LGRCHFRDCERLAVRSYRIPPGHPLEPYLADRSFVYDDALAMIALSLVGRRDEARAIGNTLTTLLTADSTLGFSFSLASPSFYNVRYVRAGTVAWAGYALALYDALTHERRFTPYAQRIADRLLASRIDAAGDPRAGLVPGGRGAWRDHYRSFDPLHVAAYCATEHQIDAYFLLDALAGSDPTGRYRAAADQLGARIVDALWLPSEGRFAVAVTERGVVTDRALDAAGAWGALFLLARGDRARAERSLDYTLRTFTRRGSGLRGYAPYAGRRPTTPVRTSPRPSSPKGPRASPWRCSEWAAPARPRSSPTRCAPSSARATAGSCTRCPPRRTSPTSPPRRPRRGCSSSRSSAATAVR
jgi:hypothetical protein